MDSIITTKKNLRLIQPKLGCLMINISCSLASSPSFDLPPAFCHLKVHTRRTTQILCQ